MPRTNAPRLQPAEPETMEAQVPIPAAGSLGSKMSYINTTCNCAHCMRKAGPMREDTFPRIEAIAYVLANVYEDSPDPEQLVTAAHRQRAAEFMDCVEKNDADGLASLFDSLEDEDQRMWVAEELIISAAQLGHAEVIKYLGGTGLNVDIMDEDRGATALMYAATNGHTAAVKALWSLGADLEATDNSGYTALIVAVFTDRSGAAAALLEAGAEVDAVDSKGRTALSYAAMYGSVDCLHVLAAAGADPAHEDDEGFVPLDLAEGSSRPEAVAAIRRLLKKVELQRKRETRKAAQQRGVVVSQAQAAVDLAQRAAEAEERAKELMLEEAAAKAAGKGSRGSKSAAGKAKKGAAGKKNGSNNAAAAGGARQQQFGALGDAAADDPAADTGSDGREDGSSGRAAAAAAQEPAAAPPVAIPGPAAAAAHEPAPRRGPAQQQQQQLVQPPPLQLPSVSSLKGEALRREWEDVLDEASKCRDEALQPVLLARVQQLLPLCSDAGISVKYGKKVLQRLELVAPARAALRAALCAQPCPTSAELDAALRGARPASSLLEPALLAEAEAALEAARRREEQARWDSLASQLQGFHTSTQQPAAAGSGAGPAGGAQGGATSASGAAAAISTAASGLPTEDELECVVCYEALKCMCCIPCGHVCMCESCAGDIQAKGLGCPVCRTPLELVFQIDG